MLARLALLLFWCLVFWGTIFDLSVLFTLVTQGAGPVQAALLSPPRLNAAAAWGNRICGLLAVFVWTVVLGGCWTQARRSA